MINALPAATAAPVISVRRLIVGGVAGDDGVSSIAEAAYRRLSTDDGAATIAAAVLVVRGSTLGGLNAL